NMEEGMVRRHMTRTRRMMMLMGAALLFAGVILAQAPPGPITPPPSTADPNAPPPRQPARMQPRKNILGAWRLNRDESDDPKTSSNQRKVNDPSSSHGGYGGPRVRGGSPGAPGSTGDSGG